MESTATPTPITTLAEYTARELAARLESAGCEVTVTTRDTGTGTPDARRTVHLVAKRAGEHVSKLTVTYSGALRGRGRVMRLDYATHQHGGAVMVLDTRKEVERMVDAMATVPPAPVSRRRVPLDRWLVTSAAGEELAIVDGATYADATADACEATGLPGGFFLRRLSEGERVVKADRNLTPDLFH